MDEARKYIMEQKAPPWTVEKFISHEIGRRYLQFHVGNLHHHLH